MSEYYTDYDFILGFNGDRNRYEKLIETYRKKLIEEASQSRPSDYGYVFNFIHIMLRFMYDFYKNGDNVHGADNPGFERLNIIKKLLHLYKKVDKAMSLMEGEEDAVKNFTDYFGKYILYLWD